MSHVIYRKSDSNIHEAKSGKTYYTTESAAKAAMTRLSREGEVTSEEYAIAETGDYYQNIEQQRQVRNLMTGKIVMESVNTPRCCSVGSELYWSM